MDDIISQVILSENFPNLSQIILTGFSGGGQFMNRYASSNRIQEEFESEYNLDFQYIVASPSSYLYFNEERRVDGTVDQFETPNSSNCGIYNNYKYGTIQMNQYMKYYHLDTLINRYKRRKYPTELDHVIIILTLPQWMIHVQLCFKEVIDWRGQQYL